MPRKAAHMPRADQNRSEGGASTVDRTLALLACFTIDRPTPSLIELAAETGLYKSTVLRLLASLRHARIVRQQAGGRYALGPEVARLNQVFQRSFAEAEAILPHLRTLVEKTNESAAFYVPQGDRRLCLYRIDCSRPLRDSLKVGDLLPLDRGAAGRVIQAFQGAVDDRAAAIRAAGAVALRGDRVPELSAIAAPAFTASGDLLGAVTLIIPSERFTEAFVADVVATGKAITRDLGGA
ncbi:MAG TPA: helix-turn-helix domain-containing protein [Beijerinckiaceae bacterium]|nr:helix-turn-helix domain-containing protein [Beijerinckiaceae bacterium]